MPLQFSLEIAGIPKELRSGSLQISRNMNGRATASFAIMSADQSYRPPLNATVDIQVDNVTIFGGLITVPREKGLHGGVKPNIVTQVTAADYNIFADRRFLLEEFAGGTLKQFLQLVETYLTGYGVTLDGGQVDGPTLPALNYRYRRVSDALNEAMAITAQFGDQYAWIISETKVLSAFQPTGVPAPFDIIADGNGAVREVIGDIEVEQNMDAHYNRVIIKVAPRAEVGRIETFAGDGATFTYSLTYTLTASRGIIHVYELDGITPAGGETFGIPPDSPLQWSYDPDTNTITRLLGPTDATKIYSLTFDGTFSVEATAEDAADIALYGLIETVINVEEIPEGSTAQSLADGYLAQSLPLHHAIRYRTLQHGLAPAQTQTITVPARNLNSAAIITAVNMREFGPARVEYSIEATLADDTSIRKAFADIYKLWRGDFMGTGGGGTTQGAGVPATIGPAPPVRSIQFNRYGTFGGNAAHLFYEEYQTVTLGDDHTAAGLNNLLVGAEHTVV